mmetsp:Transcript_32694/g.84390  ORF Transcript_32694/g.84390 Transcript_32694/m.84390 type:complete len:234 (+) Transcript_32694:342-1043(+)
MGPSIEKEGMIDPLVMVCPAFNPNTSTLGTVSNLKCTQLLSFTNNPASPFTGTELNVEQFPAVVAWIDGYPEQRQCIMATATGYDVEFADSQVFCTLDAPEGAITFYPYSNVEITLAEAFGGFKSKYGAFVPPKQGRVIALENEQIISDMTLPVPQFVRVLGEREAIGYPAAPGSTFFTFHYASPLPVVYSQVFIYTGWQFLATFGGMAAGVYVGYKLIFWILCRILKLDPEA